MDDERICVISRRSRTGYINKKQGNSVVRDLPTTGSEANTTICLYICILHIDSHYPYLLLFFVNKEIFCFLFP